MKNEYTATDYRNSHFAISRVAEKILVSNKQGWTWQDDMSVVAKMLAKTDEDNTFLAEVLKHYSKEDIEKCLAKEGKHAKC